MILLHRLTPLLAALCAAAGFYAASRWGVPWAMFAAWLAVTLLFARLCQLSPRSFQFWYFTGTPAVFLIASDGFMLLLEGDTSRTTLAAVSCALLFLFGELVFAYIHAPAIYQAYAIEHLSLALNVCTVFFLSALMFGLRMLLELPLWALGCAFAATVLFVMYGTLWVGKVEGRAAFAYAFALTALATELFVSASFLPTGYLTDAAFVAVAAYVCLGLVRARFLNKMSDTVVRRYAAAGVVLLAVVMGGARWA